MMPIINVRYEPFLVDPIIIHNEKETKTMTENNVMNRDTEDVTNISHFANGEIEINGVRYIPESVLMSGKYTPKSETTEALDIAKIHAAGAVLAAYLGSGNDKAYHREILLAVKDASEFLSTKLQKASEDKDRQF